MAVKIPLTRGYVALVDEADAPTLLAFPWHVTPLPDGRLYASRSGHAGEPHTVRMHRQLLKPPSRTLVDHVDGNGLNNQRQNLRFANHAQNRANAVSPYGLKGISMLRGGGRIWQAQITTDGRSRYLGVFYTAEEAGRAYDAEARKFFGAFARLNFPEVGEQSALLPPFAQIVPLVEKRNCYPQSSPLKEPCNGRVV